MSKVPKVPMSRFRACTFFLILVLHPCGRFAWTQAASSQAAGANAPAAQEDVKNEVFAKLEKDCKIEEAKSETDPAKQKALLATAINCVKAITSAAKQKASEDLRTKRESGITRKENEATTKTLDSLVNQSLTADIATQIVAQPVANGEASGSAQQSIASAGMTPPPAETKTSPTKTAETVGPNEAPASQPATANIPARQSVWATPNACSIGTSTAGSSALLSVHRVLMRPQDVADDFGYRLGRRFIVYQVTVTNSSPDFQYEVSDIVVDLEPIFTKIGARSISVKTSDGKTTENQDWALFQGSSQDLDLLRGIPEKGQDYDPRNMTLHIFQGVGSVGAAVSGLTPFSDVMGPAMGDFNGAFMQAFTGIAPDHTATQLNRLSDMAFTSNVLIEKLHTKNFAVFIPESFVLNKDEIKDFWKRPRQLLNSLPLDQLNICVDGLLLTQAKITPDPTFSTTESLVPANTSISISDSAQGSSIYYTTNGDTPTANSSKYSEPLKVGEVGTPALQLKVLAIAPNDAPSNVISKSFTAAAQSDPPKIACAQDGKSATISLANSGDTLYYTTTGTTPSRQSPSATQEVNITVTTPLKIQAIEAGPKTALSKTASGTCPSSQPPASPSTPAPNTNNPTPPPSNPAPVPGPKSPPSSSGTKQQKKPPGH